MDFGFENFMMAKGLRDDTMRQYRLYFDKIELLYKSGNLNQDNVYEFLKLYKSSLVRSALKLYFEYRGIKDLTIPKRTGSKVARKKPIMMSENDYRMLLEVLYQYNEQIALMVELSYECALRRQEVCNILVKDINWEDWIVNRKTGLLTMTHTKGGKDRVVVVPSKLMNKLKDYVNASEVTGSNYLFFRGYTEKNEPIRMRKYWEVYHEAVIQLFGKKYKLHTLRSSKATDWFEKGIDIVRIQQRLGHSDISTTRLYINPDEKKEINKWRDEDDKEIMENKDGIKTMS